MTSFYPRDFLPTPNNWFASDIEYEGWGRAEFSDPKGSLEGPVSIRFDELGGVSIEMTPDPSTLHSERELRFGLGEFLSGQRPKRVGDQWVRLGTLTSRNPCTRLEVEGPQGVFSSEEVPYFSPSTLYGDVEGAGVQKISFEVLWSQFAAAGAREPKYWVLPLTNFVSDFRWPAPDALDRHPLRIFPTPDVPDEIIQALSEKASEEDRRSAWLAVMAANSKNRIITFEFGGAYGFVERVPEYEELRDSLLAEEHQTRLTAVMVGEIGSNQSVNFDEVVGWMHPWDLLALLTLATGSEVGAPWIEFRDEEGGIVKRFHRRLREPRFRKGYRVIDELPIHGEPERPTGTGRLITRATSRSDDFGEAFLQVAITHLVRSRYNGQTLEESVVYLSRALDSLCERYGLARQNLMTRLDTTQQAEVRDTLRAAAKRIRELKGEASVAGDHRGSATLATIEARIPDIATTERKFGLAVTDLLELFGMPDAHAMDEHYQAHPRTDGMQHWSDVVSYYRGLVIHQGHLNLAGGTEWRDVWAVINHLHDVTARVVLRILEYDGGYQPTAIPHRSVPFELDWVKPDTPAGALGYKYENPPSQAE
jgi:hypothetical protein